MLLSCFLSLLNSDVSVQSSLLNSDVSVYRLLSCFLSLLNGDVCVQRLEETITKHSPTLGRDAEYIKSVSLGNSQCLVHTTDLMMLRGLS